MRILLVEDHKGVREAIESALSLRGYHVNSFSNSKEAIQGIKSRIEYDLAIIDRSLDYHKYSGDSVMEFSKTENPKIPVLCLSAYEDLPKNADRYLVKPFGTEKLLTMVETWIKRD